jgi:hypothetical protein
MFFEEENKTLINITYDHLKEVLWIYEDTFAGYPHPEGLKGIVTDSSYTLIDWYWSRAYDAQKSENNMKLRQVFSEIVAHIKSTEYEAELMKTLKRLGVMDFLEESCMLSH